MGFSLTIQLPGRLALWQLPAAAAAAPQPPPGRRVSLGGLGAATVGGGAGTAGWTWRWGCGEDGDGDGVGGFSAIFLGLYTKWTKTTNPWFRWGPKVGVLTSNYGLSHWQISNYCVLCFFRKTYCFWVYGIDFGLFFRKHKLFWVVYGTYGLVARTRRSKPGG